MAATPTDAGAPVGGAEPNHGRRILVVWLIASVICVPLVVLLLGPHLPPGAMSSSSRSQQVDLTVLAAIATPVILGVWIYFGYALTFWRQQDGDDTDGPPMHGHARIQVGWITVTSAIVLALAVYGTIELIAPAGAGAGEGPQPIWKPNGQPLQVQVIGQQWRFSYRYPAFGGMETNQLVLPVGQPVQFNVTSLDVIHSFWAYQLGVKADARQGHDRRELPVVGAADRGFAGRDHQDPAALCAGLRPHRDPAARQDPDQQWDYWSAWLLLPDDRSGPAMMCGTRRTESAPRSRNDLRSVER